MKLMNTRNLYGILGNFNSVSRSFSNNASSKYSHASSINYGLSVSVSERKLSNKQKCNTLFGPMRFYSAHFSYVPDTVPSNAGETVRMNLFQAVNNAMGN